MTVAPWLEVDLGPGVTAGVTTTALGNLSSALGDAPEAVARRRSELERLVGAPVVWLRQVHGTDVHLARTAGDECAVADAAVAGPGVAVAVLVADCVPVLLADAAAGVVAAVHAGRRGVLAGVVGAAVARTVAAGAGAGRLVAAVGPAICAACYEVPGRLRDEAEAVVPGIGATTSWGTPSLDLPGAVLRQLADAGVGTVVTSGVCTRTDDSYFSHRAASEPNGTRPHGRFAAAVALA